jgi:hypothetical protein
MSVSASVSAFGHFLLLCPETVHPVPGFVVQVHRPLISTAYRRMATARR